MENFDLLIIGGGAAGMAAAAAAAPRCSVLLVDSEPRLGGILNQCVHQGFGDGCTGPEYAAALIQQVEASGVSVQTSTFALQLFPNRTALLSRRSGVFRVGFRRCLIAAGCYERTIGALPVSGTRPAGVFTAGTVQRLLCDGYPVGNRILVLGSGDVGQIVARQLVQSGQQVLAVVEQRDRLGGLARNRRDCIEAYHIPVLLRTTAEVLHGQGRLDGVTVRHLDTGARQVIACDTLVTAVGLIPDRTLCQAVMENSALPGWLGLCGNCDYVHDMVERVTAEAKRLGGEFGRMEL
ncbi:MAG: FAD-dependent oxidoreductase [Oscillospiraceae bacterium]|nr:FAD-dependent oxidoreductase [Oscillospiraceae bacterium]